MARTAIEIKYLGFTNTKPSRLKASTLSAHPVSATVTYFSGAANADEDRYKAALEALLARLPDGWGDASEWIAGETKDGRVYVRGGGQ